MNLTPATPEAMDLLMQGAQVFAAIERYGLCVDVPLLDNAIRDTTQRIAELKDELRTDPVADEWHKFFGQKMNFQSPQQLGTVIFNCLGYKRNPLIEGNDEHAFKHVDLPFVKNYFEVRKLDKALGTFLLGIKKEVVDGIVHPFEDLHTATSYRPSSSNPNFANQPRRNKKIAKIVRSCIIPRGVFIEADFESHEVRSSCFYHHDDNFERYVLGGGDMHHDSAKDVYLLSDVEIGPEKGPPRDATKNKFVFPGFYGAYYITMTPDLWDIIDDLEMTTAQGVPMKEHLRSKGIKSRGRCDPKYDPGPGTFEKHIRNCQDLFWQRFPKYVKWKQDWWQQYQRCGGFQTLSGFTSKGIFQRNQVLCNANQGTAFHCLLWTLIKTRNEFLRRKMQARIVLQIYDSMLIDCPESEVSDVVNIVRKFGLQEIRKHWRWISVPLSISFEICKRNWFEKEKLVA